MIRKIISFCCLSLLAINCFAFDSLTDFTPINQVVNLNTSTHNNNVVIHWKLHPGFQIFKDKIQVSAKDESVTLGKMQFPESYISFDTPLGYQEVYDKDFDLTVPVLANKDKSFNVTVQYQSCKGSTYCYPPQTQNFTITMPHHAQSSIHNQNLILLILSFIGLGLLLTFTPCVLPMIPIIIAVVVDFDKKHSWHKRLRLCISYVLGIVATYTAIGFTISETGQSLQVLVQTPILIAATSILFVIFALALMDLFHIKMPHKLENKLHGLSHKQQSGTYVGVFIMGFISALVVSPCLTAPLAAILSYMALNGSVLQGTISLMSLAIGMGIPLILVGTLGPQFLPKSGSWMITFKKILGFIMLAFAIWLASRILSEEVIMLLSGIYVLTIACYLGLFQRMPKSFLVNALAIACFVYGIVLMVSGLAGGHSYTKPLSVFFSKEASALKISNRITTVSQLEVLLTKAKIEKKPIIIDYYASWCLDCKIMEKTIFSQKDVQQQLKNVMFIQADITENSEDSKLLMDKYKIPAPPSIVLIKNGNTQVKLGMLNKKQFLSLLHS